MSQSISHLPLHGLLPFLSPEGRLLLRELSRGMIQWLRQVPFGRACLNPTMYDFMPCLYTLAARQHLSDLRLIQFFMEGDYEAPLASFDFLRNLMTDLPHLQVEFHFERRAAIESWVSEFEDIANLTNWRIKATSLAIVQNLPDTLTFRDRVRIDAYSFDDLETPFVESNWLMYAQVGRVLPNATDFSRLQILSFPPLPASEAQARANWFRSLHAPLLKIIVLPAQAREFELTKGVVTRLVDIKDDTTKPMNMFQFEYNSLLLNELHSLTIYFCRNQVDEVARLWATGVVPRRATCCKLQFTCTTNRLSDLFLHADLDSLPNDLRPPCSASFINKLVWDGDMYAGLEFDGAGPRAVLRGLTVRGSGAVGQRVTGAFNDEDRKMASGVRDVHLRCRHKDVEWGILGGLLPGVPLHRLSVSNGLWGDAEPAELFAARWLSTTDLCFPDLSRLRFLRTQFHHSNEIFTFLFLNDLSELQEFSFEYREGDGVNKVREVVTRSLPSGVRLDITDYPVDSD